MSQTVTSDGHGSVPEEVKPKIPLTRQWPPAPLRVNEKQNGEWERNDYTVHEMPADVARAYIRYLGVPKELKELDSHPLIPGTPSDYPTFESSDSTVWMCNACADRNDQYGDRGYLTQQKACKVTVRRTPSCSHEWEEEAHVNRGILEWGSAEPWGVEIKINGEDSAPTSVDRNYTLVVKEYPEWDYTLDPIDSTEYNLPSDGTVEIHGETNGKEWTANVSVGETVSVDWRREIPSGEVLEGTTSTQIREQKCNGSSFSQVYPGDGSRKENYLPLHEMESSDFPNHASHFGRMVSVNGSNRLTGHEMVEQVSEAIMEFYRSR